MLLDARQACSFTDYMVILTGESDRQINTIREELIQSLKKSEAYARHVEGDAGSGWVLIDYVDTVIHIFSPAEREYYGLDTLWSQATPVVHIQ